MEKNENINLINLSEIKNNNFTQKRESPKPDYNKTTTRYLILDNFKGVLIFTVVFSHFLIHYANIHVNSVSRKIVVFIYFFHMQAFVFISGFLTSDNSIKLKNAIKLLILYYIFNFSFSLFLYFYINEQINFLFPYYSFWYILSLFYWRILIKYLNNIPFILIISIIISLLIGYWDCFSNVLSVYRTIIFFPYFLSGYKLSKMKIIDKFIIFKKGKIKFLIYLIFFLSFSYLVILYIIKIQIDNSAIFMTTYNVKSTIIHRVIIMTISSIMIILFLLILPNSKLPIINKWGKNSLFIYIFHRIFPFFAFYEFFDKKKNSEYIIEYSFIFTLIILFIFGSDVCNKFCNTIINSLHKNIIEYNIKGKIISSFIFLSFIILLMIKPISISFYYKLYKEKEIIFEVKKEKNFYEENLKNYLNNSIRISYIGDLILLKDYIIAARNNITGKYEFDKIFQYTSQHFHESDLSIGVFEGPCAGKNKSYSTGNNDDGKPLYLNFPDEFAEAVRNAGINLVTTANNHLLDNKIEGAMRTIDILDKNNISHVGSYRNNEEKNKIFIINVKGIKIAILAYTSMMNHYKLENLYENYGYITNILPKTNNKYYEQIYKEIENDFKKSKKESPDIIIVLVHMGDEFLHYPNKFQDKWNKIFSDLGADIILGDHSHTVQPLQYINNTLVVNSPGNFANSFIKFDGDATALIDIYIHKNTKKVLGAGIIPMYSKELKPKYFSPIPIYDLINNKSFHITESERKRVEEIQLMITKVIIGKEIGLNESKQEYFFINNSFYDFNENQRNFCKTLEKYSENEIYKTIKISKSITFIGDSITEGTKNGFHPWYEPMIKCFINKKIINISKGGNTIKMIINNYANKIMNSKSDLYIVAIGTNDIRYRDSSGCAMNSNEYISQIKKLVDLINNNQCKFIFIAPWLSSSDDTVSKINHFDKQQLIKEYSSELKNYTQNNNFFYVDPNEYIEKIILKNKRKYMMDFIHPNNKDGIELYSKAIFKSK